MKTLRNPIFANADNTLINCEIEHPNYGWIPFTASDTDSEQEGREIYAALVAAGNIAAYVPPAPPLTERKAAKTSELNHAYESALAKLVAGYPEAEQKSWARQEAEATAYTADNSASTPFLSALASERGITVAQLAPLVLANAQAFAQASAVLTGRRQKARDAIADAANVAALDAVTYDFVLGKGR